MLRKIIWLGVLAAAMAATGLAQSTGEGDSSALRVYGSGERPALRYSGSEAPRNFYSLDLGGETTYDNNVLNKNTQRFGDEVFGLSGRLAFRQERKRLTFGLFYQQDGFLYRELRGRNALDHGLGVDLSYTFNPRLSVRVRNFFDYRTSLFYSDRNDGATPELVLPARMNETILTPLARRVEDSSRVDTTYRFSRRSTVTAFGGFVTRQFRRSTDQELALRDSQEVNSGLQYGFRLNRETMLSGLYLFQNLRYEGLSRVNIHNFFFSVARQVAPGVNVSVFGGPQYSQWRNRFTTQIDFLGARYVLSGTTIGTSWHPAFGGDIAWQADRNLVLLTARRVVTDGGGLLVGGVTNTAVDFHVRRRVGRGWHAFLRAGGSQSKANSFNGTLNAQSAGAGVERVLSENLLARAHFNFVRQRSGDNFPIQADIDRSRVGIGIFYRLRAGK